MTVDQVSWLLLALAALLFVVVFVSSGKADRANKRFLRRLKGRKRK